MGFHLKILIWALIFLLQVCFPTGKSMAMVITSIVHLKYKAMDTPKKVNIFQSVHCLVFYKFTQW